jgi:alcohol dehydrogenase YqhD (iron-dependent ADH family)
VINTKDKNILKEYIKSQKDKYPNKNEKEILKNGIENLKEFFTKSLLKNYLYDEELNNTEKKINVYLEKDGKRTDIISNNILNENNLLKILKNSDNYNIKIRIKNPFSFLGFDGFGKKTLTVKQKN